MEHFDPNPLHQMQAVKIILLQKRCGLSCVQCSMCKFQLCQNVLSEGPLRWQETMLAHFKQRHIIIFIDVARPLPTQTPAVHDNLPSEIVRMGYNQTIVDQRRHLLYQTLILHHFHQWCLKFVLMQFQSETSKIYMCILCKEFFTLQEKAETHLIRSHCQFTKAVEANVEDSSSESSQGSWSFATLHPR